MSNVLDRLRKDHHKVAKLFAAGFSISEIAIQTNRDENSISDLESDPAFVSLVCHYKEKSDEAD